MDPQWADLLLGPIISTTISKLITVAAGKISLAVNWRRELATLQEKLTMIKYLLEDAEERRVRDLAVKHWLEKLKDVAREIDDVLDEVAYESVKRRVLIENQMKKKVCFFFTHSNPIAFRIKMGNKIKKTIASVDRINYEAQQFGLQSRFAVTVSEDRSHPQTHSFIGDPSRVVGRENDVSRMVQLLTDSTNELPLCVLSIVGMPGLGKTTLAKSVCNNMQIQKYFGRIMWVCVSESFDVERIVVEMFESLTKNSCAIRNKDTVVQKIRDELGENNYLLVLDDVWNEESEKWADLKSCLLGICKKSGNRIVVTTRNENVALIMETRPEHRHHLQPLNDDECWCIIMQRVFGDDSAPLELVEIGRDIAKKCGGVPLVASVIGGTLCIKRPCTAEWLSVKIKIDAMGSLEFQNNGIMQVLKLSFDRLPHPTLKQCFALCSIFPKDFVMRREMLIQLWMAEGFIQLSEESTMTMEDIGNEYFNDLLSYSLFQMDEKDSFGSITTCKMHDLIHDFAQLISKSETVILETSCWSNISKVRHLNLICGREMVPMALPDDAQLHTLFSRHGFPHGMSGNFKRLRVLSSCDDVDIEELPPCFGNMKSMRYLDISGTRITKLPKFITKLYNLQTFRFMTCRSLKMPPKGIENLINLRHIYFSDEEQMPTNIGRLTCLQTLPLFFVGTTQGRKIEELGCLSRLRGSLKIHNLELVKDKLEAMEAKLHEKAIYELELRWGKGSNQDEDVMEGLQPHSNLQRLTIEGYEGNKLPSWMSKSDCGLASESFLLRNLVKLRIQGCQKLESIPTFVTLPSLKEIEIYNCPMLESVSISGLSLLLKLRIQACPALCNIGDTLSTSKCLKELFLWGCDDLRFIPRLFGLTSLQKLTLVDCYRIECLPSGLSSCIALEVLKVRGCENLISIPEELKELHSLVYLEIILCSRLRSIPENTLSCISLKTLRIGGFSKELEEFPSLSSIHCLQTSLENLDLFGWKKLTELSHQIQNITSLKSLAIFDFNEVETLPEWLRNTSFLKSLCIVRCLRLKYVPELPSTLESLEICECPNLVSIQEQTLGHLACLKRLTIGAFSNELEEFPGLRNLSISLEKLTLVGWEKLTQLPHEIQRLTTLSYLLISGFDGVEALPEWLKDLSSLQCLKIKHCKNLKHLPSAEAIRCLSKLKSLCILDCPELEIRCGKSGPEWSKISHIPHINVKGVDI
ncbi:hypothetical protein SLE2022_125000 [Rubroshorea leprosula]